MTALLGGVIGAGAMLVARWLVGRVWEWTQRRRAHRATLSPTWLHEHGSKSWK